MFRSICVVYLLNTSCPLQLQQSKNVSRCFSVCPGSKKSPPLVENLCHMLCIRVTNISFFLNHKIIPLHVSLWERENFLPINFPSLSFSLSELTDYKSFLSSNIFGRWKREEKRSELNAKIHFTVQLDFRSKVTL